MLSGLAHCTGYSGASTCSGCESGYYVNDSTCAAIPTSLSACKSANSGMCSIDGTSYTKVSTSMGNYYVMTNPTGMTFYDSTCPSGTRTINSTAEGQALCGKTPATSQTYVIGASNTVQFVMSPPDCTQEFTHIQTGVKNAVCIVEAN